MSASATTDIEPSSTAPDPITSPLSGAAVVLVAGGLLALNRFGGLATTAPRAFLRLVLIVTWGWVGLAIAIWLLGAAARSSRPRVVDLSTTLSRVGRGHVSIVGLALVLFVAAGALQLRWPGLLAAAAVFAWWFPVALLAAVPDDIGRGRRAAVVIAPYTVWLATVGSHLSDRLGHLV